MNGESERENGEEALMITDAQPSTGRDSQALLRQVASIVPGIRSFPHTVTPKPAAPPKQKLNVNRNRKIQNNIIIIVN